MLVFCANDLQILSLFEVKTIAERKDVFLLSKSKKEKSTGETAEKNNRTLRGKNTEPIKAKKKLLVSGIEL